MNIYVWEYADGVTDSLHDGGGVLVVAATVDKAREQWGEYARNFDGVKPLSNTALDDDPQHVWPTEFFAEERIIVFPDLGCC